MATASREFQVFAKPAGAACNLECRYCYYLGTADLYPRQAFPRMPDEVLETYIARHIEAAPGPVVNFSWHGGEPTVLGLDYFRRIVDLQRRHLPAGRRVTNGMQTNGILIDEAWVRFLASEGFRVGLSLDGPAGLHDVYRVTRGQEPTHARVVHAFDLLQRYRVPHDVLCVVHDRNVREPLSVYRFFRRIGARSLSFLPLVERRPGEPGGVSERSVPAEAYGEFLCAIFDEWVRRDAARLTVQIFEEASRPALGLEHSLCIFRETCGDVPVVEHTGDVYACDHFVDVDHRIGNVRDTPLSALIDSPAQRAFGEAKRDSLPRACRTCDVLLMCHGGCPKDRFIRSADGEDGLNYLCVGFKRFFTHSLPWVVRLATERRRVPGLDAAVLAPPVASARGERYPGAGRNDPCPCGSGRKYKKCCLAE